MKHDDDDYCPPVNQRFAEKGYDALPPRAARALARVMFALAFGALAFITFLTLTN